MTEMYVSLSYEEYKFFEDQLENYPELETSHGEGQYYHKAFRLKLGDLTLEVHGPTVKAGPMVEPIDLREHESMDDPPYVVEGDQS